DVHYIKMGNKVNVQDNAMIHCTYQKCPTEIGNNVSIGHNAVVHGCTIHDNVLIGMGAIVMDDCVVESYSIVAAGAVVTQNTHIKEGELWAGIPARKIGDVSQNLKEGEIRSEIGNNVSIGHNAVVHGCTIHDNVLIGMGAIVMDDCVVESYSIVAAGAVVTQNTHIKEGELWAGIPARKIGDVSQNLKEGEI